VNRVQVVVFPRNADFRLGWSNLITRSWNSVTSVMRLWWLYAVDSNTASCIYRTGQALANQTETSFRSACTCARKWRLVSWAL